MAEFKDLHVEHLQQEDVEREDDFQKFLLTISDIEEEIEELAIQEQTQLVEEEEKLKNRYEQIIKELEEKLRKEQQARQELEKNLGEILDEMIHQVDDLQYQISKREEEVQHALQSAEEESISKASSMKQMREVQNQIQELQEDLEAERESRNSAEKQKRDISEQKDDEINQLMKETTRLNKVRETIQRRLRQIEDLKAEVEQQKEILKSQNLALETDLDATIKKVDTGKKENQDVVKKFQTEKKILLMSKEIDPIELDFLLRFPSLPNIISPVDFMNNHSWGGIKALVNMEEFRNLDRDIEGSAKRWKKFVESEAPEKEKFPLEWKNKNSLQKLCMMRALRPDRMTYAVKDFVQEKLGTKYVEGRSVEFAKSYEESGPTTPMFFILSLGVNPIKDVEVHGKKIGLSADNKNFHNISLGQGQEVVAESALDLAVKEGHWVILQNIHLVERWLPTLEKKLESYTDECHASYRVYISAEPAPTVLSHIIPQGILEISIKITNEPPTGMVANLHQALDNFDQETMEMCAKENEFKSILFSLCYFHAVVSERRKFGPQGWNRSYPFNTGDLTISAMVLYNYLEANTKVPWEDLRYLFGEIMYGGHITDDWDRRLVKTYLEVYMHPDMGSKKMKNEFQKRFEEMAADINIFKKVEQEIENYKDEAQKQKKIINQLEKERDGYINEASDLTQKVLEHMDLVKTREMKIFEYKKKIAEAETRLRQQQNLYKAVRSDCNLYSKNVIESQDEITEMKKKLKNMNHLIDQLKEYIQSKENAIVQAAVKAKKLKDKDILMSKRDKSRQQVIMSKDVINNQVAKLLKIIAEADAERVGQKKDLEQVISERDFLGTQLVRRNDELALLYEKIKIQQSTLNKGEIQYNQRLEDIRDLEIRKLRRANNILNKSEANVGDLR